jgi:hypothetical protein
MHLFGGLYGGLAVMMIAGSACNSPSLEDFEGNWRLTAVNGQQLPVLGNSTSGEIWAAAVLQINRNRAGSLESCREDPSTGTQITRSSAFVISPVDGDEVTFSYFDDRSPSQDTATIDGSRLILRYGDDVLTFVSLTGDMPDQVCDLAP